MACDNCAIFFLIIGWLFITNNFDTICFSIKMHEERKTKQKKEDQVPEGAVPAYLLDREGQSRAKVLSNMIKQKRKEKAVSIFVNTLDLCTTSSLKVIQGYLATFT